ncbi:MAG: TIM barrel protein [Spirochaetes bacterium]|nr:TIM barrel protein [Spirochaetota bacterium]
MGVQWGRAVTDLSQADRAAADGFEFAQAAAALVPSLDDGQVLRQMERLRTGGVPFTVCGVPLPADVQVTQQGFNLYVWTEHVKRSLHRMADLGCRKIVWSDGRARVLPVEGEVAGLKEQALQFLFMLCEAAGTFGMTVLVEPLGPRRTNFLNSMKEIGEFLPRVGKDNLSSMVSLRELEPIGLSPAQLHDHRHLIGHVQMENPKSADGERRCPRPDDGHDYRPFLRALRGIGYSGLITLPADADAAGLEFCRRLWKE